MSQLIASHVYDLYGRFYDSFDPLFKRRLAKAIAALPCRPQDHLLDIGVGTGLSLAYYPPSLRVTGIDLSAGMLRQAQHKLDRGLVRATAPRSHTHLIQADALHLPFADNSFDLVFLSHVISTVPDPHLCLAEALRVARPDSYIVLVNHFRSENPFLHFLEQTIDPLCRKLGWRCDLSLSHLLRRANVNNLHHLPSTEGILFRIVYLQKHKSTLSLIPTPHPLTPEPALTPA